MDIQTSGSGPPLILLHGWAMHSGIFSDFATELSQRFTVHAVDLPGHGHSNALAFEPAQTIALLQQHLLAQREPVTLIGWSMGGTLACECALALVRAGQQRHLRAIACIASTPKFVADANWPSAMPMTHFERFHRDLENDWQSTVERFLALEALGALDEAAELRWLKATVFARGKPNPEALRAGLALLETTDQRAQLNLLCNVPTLWLGGKRDRIVPPTALEWAATASGGRACIIERAAHAPFLSHPQRVHQELEILLNSP